MIIGLGYRAQSGKDTVGGHLYRKHGYKRISFANILSQMTMLLCDDRYEEGYEYFKQSLTRFGYTGGQLMQIIGNALRRDISPDVWIKAARLEANALSYRNLVVTDVRFENEAAEIKRLGGVLWEIRRSGVATDPLESEGRKIPWDSIIYNNGSKEDLYAIIDQTLASCKLAAGAYTPVAPPGLSLQATSADIQTR